MFLNYEQSPAKNSMFNPALENLILDPDVVEEFSSAKSNGPRSRR